MVTYNKNQSNILNIQKIFMIKDFIFQLLFKMRLMTRTYYEMQNVYGKPFFTNNFFLMHIAVRELTLIMKGLFEQN